jgi:hypothetical protein
MSNSTLTIASPKPSITEATQLTINKNLYPTLPIGGHKFLSIPVSEYVKIDPIPINRNSQNRVSSMKSTFDESYFTNRQDTLTTVALGIAAENFTDPTTGFDYKIGDCFILDGNTRKYYWLSYPDKAALTSHLAVKIHFLRNFDDVESTYYSYDNRKSAEKTSEILQGLIRRYNWTPRQNVFSNGGFGTAIQVASRTRQGQTNKDLPDVWGQFDLCFDGLKILDGIPKGDGNTITKPKLKGMKSQIIIAALLTALRTNPNNLKLHDMIDRLSNIEFDEIQKGFVNGAIDSVQIIAAEYVGYSQHRGGGNTQLTPWLINADGKGSAGSTKYADVKPQMDFLLYWIGEYMSYGKKTVSPVGVKPSYWNGDYYKDKGAWEEFLPDQSN